MNFSLRTLGLPFTVHRDYNEEGPSMKYWLRAAATLIVLALPVIGQITQIIRNSVANLKGMCRCLRI
jgi:hypothetical protein